MPRGDFLDAALKPLGGLFGASLGPLGASFGPLRGLLGASRGHVGALGAILGGRARRAPSTYHLRGLLGPFGLHFGMSWRHLGPSWRHLWAI